MSINSCLVNRAQPKCGEIWLCRLESYNGSIQRGYRPVYILSNNENNTYSNTLNVIPLTSRMNKRNLPVHVELWDYHKYGLKSPSTLMVEQIMTITSNSLDRKIGTIADSDTMNRIRYAISVQFPVMAACQSIAI